MKTSTPATKPKQNLETSAVAMDFGTPILDPRAEENNKTTNDDNARQDEENGKERLFNHKEDVESMSAILKEIHDAMLSKEDLKSICCEETNNVERSLEDDNDRPIDILT